MGVGEAPLKSHTKPTKKDFEQRDRGEHKDTEKAENGFEQKVTKEAKGKRIKNSDLGAPPRIRVSILGTFELCLNWFLFLFFCEDSPSVGQVGVRESPITSHQSL